MTRSATARCIVRGCPDVNGEDSNGSKTRGSNRSCVATCCSCSANILLALIELLLALSGSGT